MSVFAACLLANWMIVGPSSDKMVIDSFIRDGVKPKDFERLTEKAKRGKTHLSAYGSGFFITADGYILTNHHVVENSSEVVVVHGDVAYRAIIVSKNKKRDLALMKVNLFPRMTNGVYNLTECSVPKVSFLPLSSGCSIGQTVYAVGFPNPNVLGFEPKATKGIVSSLTGYKGQKDNFQMDATIAGGCSGGPVVDEYGHMVGVIVASAHGASIGANYAINMKTVREFMPKDMKCVNGIPGRTLRAEKVVSNASEALVLVLNYGEGAAERMDRTSVDAADVNKRENDVRIRKAMLNARLCMLRKEWKDLMEITDWIISECGEVGDVREWNDVAREELGLHIVLIAEADNQDVKARVKPICGFKEDYVECGKAARLYGGLEKRGFPVEAVLEYDDDEWRWRGGLKCRYDWRGTKEVRVVMKRAGKYEKGVRE